MTAYSPPHSLAFRRSEQASTPHHLLSGRVAEWIAARMASVRARYAAAELRGASDSDLRDMGITRGDIDRLFDPDFADEFATRARAVRPRRSGGAW